MDRQRPPQMRDQFRKELRARLMQEAPIYLNPRRDNAWAAFLRPAFLRPAMAVSLASLVLIAGAGTAAAGSVPGDPAFVLKKTFEDVQVNLTFDDVQRVQLLAQIADRRLQELQQVANKDDGQQNNKDDKTVAASEEFAKAVAQFRAAVDQVQTVAPADKADKVQKVVEDSREKHGDVVDQIQQKVTSDKAKDAIERAKDEEDKNTKEEQQGQSGGGNGDKRTARPTRSPAPIRSPRPNSTQTARPALSPRPTEKNNSDDGQHSDTPRPTPRASASGRLNLTPAPPVRQTPGASEKD
jgi:hypothetical protein